MYAAENLQRRKISMYLFTQQTFIYAHVIESVYYINPLIVKNTSN